MVIRLSHYLLSKATLKSLTFVNIAGFSNKVHCTTSCSNAGMIIMWRFRLNKLKRYSYNTFQAYSKSKTKQNHQQSLSNIIWFKPRYYYAAKLKNIFNCVIDLNLFVEFTLKMKHHLLTTNTQKSITKPT